MALGVVAAFKGISAVASAVTKAKEIITDVDELDEQLDEVLAELQDVRLAIVTGVADVLEAIDGIHRQINQDVALDAMTLADRALYSDLRVFDDCQEAMGNAFEAADRLRREDELVFAGPFMYAVNIRHATVKACIDNYICEEQFRDEFRGYITQLQRWIDDLNARIADMHTVQVEVVIDRIESPPGGPQLEPVTRAGGGTVGFLRYVTATHRRDGVVVETWDPTTTCRRTRWTGCAGGRRRHGRLASIGTGRSSVSWRWRTPSPRGRSRLAAAHRLPSPARCSTAARRPSSAARAGSWSTADACRSGGTCAQRSRSC